MLGPKGQQSHSGQWLPANDGLYQRLVNEPIDANTLPKDREAAPGRILQLLLVLVIATSLVLRWSSSVIVACSR
ncbi:hypothetical protein Thiowin_03822 [Thiorhodovibrio winogradskyi]|uniref:Uncharacterized protein n=1 Tax=Thiorhodovibrio winogradskyi TaxID=77007 RepID=A0ABZ0SEI8_9GAMM|nr:hypothetical protein [Thiorhodovibrio winogradskyi]